MKHFVISLLIFLAAGAANAQAGSGFTKLANVSTLTYTDSTCPNQSSCYYQVTTLDSTGFESAPAACTSTQLCIGGNTAVFSMPSSGTHTITLNWTASPSTGVTYNVYQHIGPLPASGLSGKVN